MDGRRFLSFTGLTDILIVEYSTYQVGTVPVGRTDRTVVVRLVQVLPPMLCQHLFLCVECMIFKVWFLGAVC